MGVPLSSSPRDTRFLIARDDSGIEVPDLVLRADSASPLHPLTRKAVLRSTLFWPSLAPTTSAWLPSIFCRPAASTAPSPGASSPSTFAAAALDRRRAAPWR